MIIDFKYFIERIVDFPKDLFRNCKYGIQNLIKWGPIIWKDRDWDHWFLYKILQFKLKQMEHLQRHYGNHINNEKVADKIKLCVNLLDRLIKEDYLTNNFKSHEKKWGEHHMHFNPIPNSELGEITFSVDNANTKKEKKDENDQRMNLYKHTDNLRKQDLDMLFYKMRKYVESWWD